ncbi:LCP family glycopolymer transferase [Brachybacterium sp. J153]|uniref:LCP family glycopolymer transferase n=1 Tax=Brachybacterium sp. J153 TaxID=3116488 RepID=UPI002E75D1DA|nr:LCP family protein [Brachybacterium sp. J153]MEE1618961.1 LCP family protein [Brachybacterium sp. J153]
MTDPSSAPRRRRRRSGRHQEPLRRPTSTPLPPDQARANRNAAFGNGGAKRTWPGATTPPASSAEPAQTSSPAQPVEPSTTPVEPPTSPLAAPVPPADAAADRAARRPGHGRRRAILLDEQDAWGAPSPSTQPAPSAEPAEPSAGPDVPDSSESPDSSDASDASAASAASAASEHLAARSTAARSRREEGRAEGSLPKVAGWTVLTTVLPGAGLLTTRMRRLGIALLAVLAAVVIAGLLLWRFGDRLQMIQLLTSRTVLLGFLAVAAVVGLVWIVQIVLANLAQTTKERLTGTRRYLAFAVSAAMVVAVAIPAGYTVRSLWAGQSLLGSSSVFAGGRSADLAEGPDPWANTERVNIMLLGQDAGVDRTGTRPDTLMVASIDTKTGQTALFSIPRNLEHVRFPEGTPAAEVFPDGFRYFGQNQDLINAVWTWAEDRPDLFPGDPEPGLTATRWAVEETLGLETDYYAMVNLQGFEDLVNAIGGVDLVVERRIPIGGGAGPIDGYIEPGAQTLDGFHALWYARSREGSDDFNRMCRQQRMVRAVAEEADPATLAMSIPGLVNTAEQNIVTDIPVSDLDAFVDLALRVKDGGFTSYPITQDVTPSANADWDYLKEWTQASIEDSLKADPPESVVGETEPGSTEPAETGAAPEEEASGEESSREESSAEETTAEEETPSDEESSAEESGTGEETATEAPVIEQDPLKSCLPSNEQAG